MRKYGIENFHIELIEETTNPEEREKYWIEYLGTYKNGYNATLGGDGKHYLDYDLIIQKYKELQNIKEVARVLNYDYSGVRKILKQNNIPIKNSDDVVRDKINKKVGQYSLDGELIQIFPSLQKAGQFFGKDSKHISHCANGDRKTAYGYIWKFIEEEQEQES